MSTTTQLDPVLVSDATELQTRLERTAGEEPVSPHTDIDSSKSEAKTYLKIVSAGFSFFVAGVNDGSLGALVPFVIRDYGINTAIISSV